MGRQFFFMNHTTKEIIRTGNDADHNITHYLKESFNKHPSWSINNDISLIYYGDCDIEDIHENIKSGGYTCDCDWFD